MFNIIFVCFRSSRSCVVVIFYPHFSGIKWLKIFMPVIVILSIGMAVMMTQEIDPQITICDQNGTDGAGGRDCLFSNQTYTMTFVNAIYWGLVTGTTVGYGDVAPTTDGTKIFSVFFLVLAVITTANALSTLGDALMSSPGSDAVTNLLGKKLDADFIMSLDMDGSGEVSEYEYLAAMVSLYFFIFFVVCLVLPNFFWCLFLFSCLGFIQLVQLNHVDEDQIDSIMKAFRKLDTDGSGSLSVTDLAGNLQSEKKKRKIEVADAAGTMGTGDGEKSEDTGEGTACSRSVPKEKF